MGTYDEMDASEIADCDGDPRHLADAWGLV